MFIANLIAEPARTRVNHNTDVPHAQSHRRSRLPVKNPIDDLDFKEVVPRTERAELIFAALQRALTGSTGVRVLQKPGGFRKVKILRVPIVALNRPQRTLF